MYTPFLILLIPFILFFVIGVGLSSTQIYFLLFNREHFNKKKLIEGFLVSIFGFLFLFIHETKLDKKLF